MEQPTPVRDLLTALAVGLNSSLSMDSSSRSLASAASLAAVASAMRRRAPRKYWEAEEASSETLLPKSIGQGYACSSASDASGLVLREVSEIAVPPCDCISWVMLPTRSYMPSCSEVFRGALRLSLGEHAGCTVGIVQNGRRRAKRGLKRVMCSAVRLPTPSIQL